MCDDVLDIFSRKIHQGKIEHNVLVVGARASFGFCFPDGKSAIRLGKFRAENIEPFFGIFVENFFQLFFNSGWRGNFLPFPQKI